MLRKIATPVRCFELKIEFGMHFFQLSEVFWEVIEHFCHEKEHFLTIRCDFCDSERHSTRDQLHLSVLLYQTALDILTALKLHMSTKQPWISTAQCIQ